MNATAQGKTRVIVLPASFAQAEEVTEHHLRGGPVIIVPGEKEMLVRAARRKFPGCRVVGADLDVEKAEWSVTIQVAE